MMEISTRLFFATASRAMFEVALKAADPYQTVRHMLAAEGVRADARYDRIVVVGAGKATARMAQAAEMELGERIGSGLVVVKHGHALPSRYIEQVEAGHPVPDEAGRMAALRILNMAGEADERTLLLCLISGGGSALLVAPAEGLTLADKQQTTVLLLQAGADISELNAVRKHLSAIKGGRLVQAATRTQVLTLLLSDVIDDRLDVIASGPTAPDTSTYADALAVVEKYSLRDAMPLRALNHLRRGAAGRVSETLKPDEVEAVARVRHRIIGSNTLALNAAAEYARSLGLPVRILGGNVQGEAREAAQWLVEVVRAELAAMRPGERRCLLSGGETTVTVRGMGRGGRNQEFALAFALASEGLEQVSLLSVGTDGGDGPTEAAGAQVDGDTAAAARLLDLSPEQYLDNNDSYGFFCAYDQRAGTHSLIVTGPTGTNVMDMQVVVLQKPG